MSAAMTEEELAKHVIAWLEDQNWTVYQEVQFGYGPIADIVARKGNIIWIIETKLSLTLEVLGQANHWYSNYRSVAVREAKKSWGNDSTGRNFAYDISLEKGIGIINVSDTGSVRETISPKLQRRNNEFFMKNYLKVLEGFPQHYKNSGTKGGAYYTPYRATMDQVKAYLKTHPGATIGEIFANVITHYASQSAKSSLRQGLVSFEQDWCKIVKTEDGTRYYLKEDYVEPVLPLSQFTGGANERA